MLKSLTAVTMVFALVGYAYAEDAGGDGGQLEYVAYSAPTIDQAHGSPMSCAEARATAWFERELKRSDGDANPELQDLPCGSEVVAQRSTADAD